MQKLCFFWLLLVTVAACDIVNPAEEIPSYLTVEPIILQTDEATEGSASAKITEGWVFVDEEFIGAYSLPATVPVLFAGERRVRIQAGVHDNGINSVPEIYPFYESYEVTANLVPAETITLSPVVGYQAGVEFAFIEDFEGSKHLFMDDRDTNEDTRIEITTEDVFEGDRSGKIVLTPENSFIEVATDADQLFSGLQDEQVFVYVEVNYKSDAPVLWGVIGYDDNLLTTPTPVYDPGFNAKAEWNKIYFNFSSILFNEDFANYQFALTAVLPSENGTFTTERAEILLDNIKVVHF